jgi:PsbP-like protein
MKYLLTIFCLTIALTGFAQEWKTFSNDTILFSAQYPPDWVNKIKENKRVFFTSPQENDSDKFRENVNIGVTENPEFGVSYKINDLFPDVTNGLKKSIDQMTLESQRDFKWNDVNAVEIIYTGYSTTAPELKARFTQWFCFKNQRLYIATYTASADNTTHTETAKKILNSVKFK